MQEPWKPEQLVSESQALELIQEQFPELNATHISFLGAGWDNTAYLVENKWIFRFPRRQISVPLLEAEVAILPLLAQKLPLPIPTPIYIGKASQSFLWPFAGYCIVPGITACSANLSEEERTALAIPIANFLKELHAIPSSILSGVLIHGDNLGRINPRSIIERVTRVFDDLENLGLLENRDILEAILKEGSDLPTPKLSNLVHGDFYARHLLLDNNHQLAGIIDWGDIHIGNAAIDLAIAHCFLPREAHAAFKQAYGPISDQTWQLAKLRAIYSSAYITLFGHQKPEPDLLREGLRALRQITKT